MLRVIDSRRGNFRRFSRPRPPGAVWNDTQWDDEHFNSLRLQAQAELDPPKRPELYTEMQRILRDDGGVIVPFFANFVARRLQHGELASDNTFDGQRIAERWWMTVNRPLAPRRLVSQ